ncbi:hypothetical protein GCM10008967_24200 [Bacillus carboniphilus]|uniref:ABC transporter permease n=1 Tax=Bacillus carboniphilus TaxID=86663 RepID=A0ABN0WCD8_9BACI
MKESRIFVRRVKKSYREKAMVLKVIGDWTIWLYLFIPATVIGVIQYNRWLHEPPVLLNEIFIIFVWLLFYVVVWNGRIRPFLEEPDPVFLMKKPTSIIKLKKYALTYGIVFYSFTTLVFTILVYPILLKPLAYSLDDWLCFFCFWLVMKWFILALKRKININHKYVNHFVYTGMFLVGIGFLLIMFQLWLFFPQVLWFVIILIGVLSLAIHIHHAKSLFTFHQDLIQEQKERSKWTMWTFSMVKEIEKPKVIRRKKPIMLERGDSPLIKKRSQVNGFLELFLKVFFRNGNYVLGYAQLTLFTCIAFAVIPSLVVKIIVLVCYFFMILFWLDQVTETILRKSKLGHKYNKDIHFLLAKKKFSNILGGISLGVVLLVFFLTIQDPLAGLRSILYRI